MKMQINIESISKFELNVIFITFKLVAKEMQMTFEFQFKSKISFNPSTEYTKVLWYHTKLCTYFNLFIKCNHTVQYNIEKG